MAVESWIASLVSALLSLANVQSVVEGDGIYVFSLDHRFVVTLTCLDIVGIGLWTFIFGFVVWIYVSMVGVTFSVRKYALLSILSFPVFFLANILRMFVEIYYVSGVGPSFAGYLGHWQAFEEQMGLGIMFATFAILLLSFHLTFKNRKIPSVGVEQEWNMGKKTQKPGKF